MHTSTLLTCLGLVHQSLAGYALQDDYSGDSFFSMMSFFTGPDPTDGYVNYVDQATAQSDQLINTNNGVVYMGVDSTNVASGSGRNSVRVTSNAVYNHGLIVLDLAHMPGGVCGTWPAFWMTGPNWPNEGEIDIIEGVNAQSQNDMTLHTNAGCQITNNNLFTGGDITTYNCDVNAANQQTNAGCQIAASGAATYGTQFNNNGGGVYATEWTSDAISIWFWPQGSQPSDVLGDSPDPTGWSTPIAVFSGGCDIDTHFQNQQIVFDTTFCGSWAGAVWESSSCASLAPTCNAYVQNNPSAFQNAYWSVNSLRVYQDSEDASPSASASAAFPSLASSISQAIQTSSATPVSVPVSSTSQQPTTSMSRKHHSPHNVTVSSPSTAAAAAAASPITDTVSALDASGFPSPPEPAPAVVTVAALADNEFPNAGEAITERLRRSAKARRAAHLHAHQKKAVHI